MYSSPNLRSTVLGSFVTFLLVSQYPSAIIATPTGNVTQTSLPLPMLKIVQPLSHPDTLIPQNTHGLSSSESNNSKSNDNKYNQERVFNLHKNKYQNREGRVVHEISLSDPLDCLSQIVCGLNTYPPRPPTVRTTTANDFAYLLKNVILRLKKVPRPQPTVSTTTTAKPSKEEQNDDEDSEEDEVDIAAIFNDNEEDAEEDEEEEPEEKDTGPKTSDQTGDIVTLQDLHPPLGLYRSGREIIRTFKKITNKLQNDQPTKVKKNAKNKKGPQTPLEKLRMETDIREKLRSDARCVNGITNHTCPFRYEELMVLTSGVLERQRVVSYSSTKILPVVGYLLKSRSLTQTLKSTFMALEKINNVTIEKDKQGEDFTFNHVYDEIINGDVTGNGIMVVETKDDFANSHAKVWEDDEFDEALKHPFVPKEQIQSYTHPNKNKNSKETQEDASEESDETPQQQSGNRPVVNGAFEEIPSLFDFPDSDENDSDNAEESQEEDDDIPLPPLYGSKANSRRKL